MLAKKSGRPVKMTMTRGEVFHASGPTSGSYNKVKVGATKDGKLVAAQGTFCLQAGAFPGSPIRGAAGCAFAPYDIPNVHSVGIDVVSNRSKVAAYRAPGAPIGAHAMECVMDEIAEALKMDPLELRQRRTRTTRRPCPSRRVACATVAAWPRDSGSMPAANRARRSTSTRTARW